MSVTDTDFLFKWRKQVEEKLNWLNTDNLKQRDFQYLVDVIYEKTKTQLSLSTLKRIWDDSYKKSFQISTLDALAVFLDYQNWHNFKEQNFLNTDSGKNENPKNYKEPLKINKKKSSFRLKLAFLFITVVFITVLVLISKYRNQKSEKVIAADEILFISKKSVEEGVPNTIIFNYDVSSYITDSLYIQLSWNLKERERIEKQDHFYTCTYYYPGYHYAKLIVNDDIIKGHFVHITTKDWLTLVRYQPDDVIPTYIRNDEVISDGNMHASPYLLKLNNIDITKPEFYVSYFNIREFDNLKGDNFSFETEIKNSSEELALICQNCQIFIYGDNGTFVLPICTEGCVSDIGISAGDVRISGKTNDLSGLGCDLTDWRKIKGIVENKNLKIFIDDKMVYELDYNSSIGKIKGFHYFFKGCGSVKNLSISDSEDNIIYKDDFCR